MKIVMSWILILAAVLASEASLAGNSDLDRSKLDQSYISAVATNAIDDLNVMGLSSMCVWSNSGTDQMSGYLNSTLRIVLKSLPSTNVSNPLYDGNRVCVMLRRIQ